MHPLLLFSMPSGGEWLLLGLAIFVILLIPTIFFILAIQNALQKVAPERRRMAPGLAWLLIIPGFSLIWRFFVVAWVADSLAAEYEARGVQMVPSRPGYGVGMGYAVCSLLFIIPFAGLAALVCWIVYWVNISRHADNLSRLPAGNAVAPTVFY